MKNLELLTNHEKAKILFKLFPKELIPFMDFVIAVAETVTEEQEKQRMDWNNPLFSFDTWIAQADAVLEELQQLKSIGKSRPNEYLNVFQGTKAWFTVYCVTLYTTTRKHPNTKFATAAGLFF